jgi:hypothetical protein
MNTCYVKRGDPQAEVIDQWTFITPDLGHHQDVVFACGLYAALRKHSASKFAKCSDRLHLFLFVKQLDNVLIQER